jgi:DNA-binding SARP family transcriptional activator
LPSLRICLFGSLNIYREGITEQVKLAHSAQSLLAYLLLFRQRTHPREVLARLFWKEYPQQRARNGLNTTVWRLRQVLEPEDVSPGTYLISTSMGELGFNIKSDVWLDVEVFETQISKILALPPEKAGAEDILLLENAVKLYMGDLLEDHFSDWALRERERLRCCYLDCLYYLMNFFAVTKDLPKALFYGQEILRADPLREDVHRQIMRLHIINGRRSLAVRQYNLCRKILQDELGIPPMPETQMLHTQILGPDDNAQDDQGLSAPDTRQVLEKMNRAMNNVRRAEQNLQQAMDHFGKNPPYLLSGPSEKRLQ